jgi:hypothetical protein
LNGDNLGAEDASGVRECFGIEDFEELFDAFAILTGAINDEGIQAGFGDDDDGAEGEHSGAALVDGFEGFGDVFGAGISELVDRKVAAAGRRVNSGSGSEE